MLVFLWLVSMIRWRFTNIGLLNYELFKAVREKKAYPQRYEKTLMRWGSGLFWVYFLQCALGILISLAYTLSFDTGTPAIAHLWWETSHGSFLVRLHSEFGNLVFFFLYCHVLTKLWTSIDVTDADSYSTWLTGSTIFIFSYIAGVTGAIMPCSILGEVTATIAGSAISSMTYIKFDFLETLLVPGMSLNEESIWRSYIIHALVPILTFLIGVLHMFLLHKNKYSAAGGFKRFGWAPRFRETRRWRYTNRYWSRAFGTWLRLLVLFLVARFIGDLFWPRTMSVNYSFANFEYWPINEQIDFVLAIPHWYLRPLMGALVTIPHHYLGFIYIGSFFILLILVPWLNERGEDDSLIFADISDNNENSTTRWDSLNSINFSIFFFGAMFTAAIVPTGKYFIAIGSMDGLVFGYWFLILYFLYFSRIGYLLIRFLNITF